MNAALQVEWPRVSKLRWDGRRPPRPPDWVYEAVGAGQAAERGALQATGDVAGGASAPTLLTARLERALDRDAREFRGAVRRLIGDLLERAAEAGSPHPVRLWSFLPGIHERLGPDLSRYMVFNAGRHEAFFPPGDSHPPRTMKRLPAATGVGHPGPDLLLYCLAVARPGRPVENPRQTPAYRYSPAYGPLPPCFARATTVHLGGEDALLVSGTAAVRGEDSVHVDSLEGQLRETFVNLEALLAAARLPAGPEPGADVPRQARLTRLRVYHLREEDSDRVLDAVMERFPGLREIEMVQAEICREELLVEIEGLAPFDPDPT